LYSNPDIPAARGDKPVIKQKIALFIFMAIALTTAKILAEPFLKSKQGIILWAWERHENLLFLKEGEAEVAFLAGTVVFENSDTIFTPRLQPLIVADCTPLTAVFRIENLQGFPPSLKQAEESADIMAKICSRKNLAAVQVDFDARVSERQFYGILLKNLRRKLSHGLHLYITALASWSYKGSWIESLPLNGAVPMLFRMGADGAVARNGLAGESFMQSLLCLEYAGVSLDEPLPHAKYLRNRVIFIFNPRPWTRENLNEALLKIEKHIREDTK
jgi:hypothetical protein